MSKKEYQRVQVSERQVQRLKRRYEPDSHDWVRHGNRGRSMPWAVSPPQKQWILDLDRGKYRGFNGSHLKNPAPHLRSLRSPRFGGPLLKRQGVTESRCREYDIFSLHLQLRPLDLTIPHSHPYN